jgi:hypothetical protein
MSEISRFRSTIQLSAISAYESNIEMHPAFDILRRACLSVAERRGTSLTDSVTDASGRSSRCIFALAPPTFPRGVGVQVDMASGAVSFLYDAWGADESEARGIIDEITQTYVAIALSRALKEVGYQVEAAEETAGGRRTVILQGTVL